MTMGEKILRLRKARGWNQEELAEQIGVTRQAVSRWESDAAKPDAEKIVTLCDLFGVSADYLLREQYAGEGAALREAVPAQTEASSQTTKAAHGAALSARGILGFALFALGLVLLFGAYLVGIMEPHTLYTDHGTYYGFAAYVRVYHMEWMVWVLSGLIVSGALLMLWEPFAALLRKIKSSIPE